MYPVNCTICPRNCTADRTVGAGYCGVDDGLNIASICVHRGEEPVIGGSTGICNVFFAGCNLRCVYCQNHEISQPCSQNTYRLSDIEDVLVRITGILDTGITSLGFVSPSHMIPQMKTIICGLHNSGYRPVIVYNTNSYDKVETIKSLEGIVDVYLPDLKYTDRELSLKLSGAADYPEVAVRAMKEMYFQMGSTLHTDAEGKAERGMIIRHLVLPGYANKSKKVLDTIASELSPGISISLMSQYHPMHKALHFSPLDRSLYKSEYDEVVNHMNHLGFRNGWVQEMESFGNYLPDFSKENPFEEST